MERSVSQYDVKVKRQQPNEAWEQNCDAICPLALRNARTALRVCFLRNQDKHFGGIVLTVSKRSYPTFSKLLEAITVALRNRVLLKSAIVKLCRINGTLIRTIYDFCAGDIVVCCCQYEPFMDVGYNVSKANVRWLNACIYMPVKARSAEEKSSDGVKESSFDMKPEDLPQAIHLYINVSEAIWRSKSATIFKGIGRAHDNKPCSIKVVDREKMGRSARDTYFEIQILRKLQDHDNIVELIYTVEHNRYDYIVMEHLDCDLHTLYAKMLLGDKNIKRIMRDITKGLAYIHSRQIIHRDIKPENILVKLKDPNLELPYIEISKISDFGFATYYQGRELYEWCGTPHYMAPEIISFQGYDFNVDMWALGVTLFLLLCDKLPFGGIYRDAKRIQKCVQITKNHRFPTTTTTKISLEAQNLVNLLLVKASRNRLSAQEACHHPFLD